MFFLFGQHSFTSGLFVCENANAIRVSEGKVSIFPAQKDEFQRECVTVE
jgi:hypothetical protein